MKCKYECVASYPGTAGPASVRYGHCPFDNQQPGDCYQRQHFDELVAEYQKAGNDRSEALYKARLVLNIPTAYDITGEVRLWRETYRPGTVPEVRAREAEVKKKLCAVADPDPVKPVAHCPAPERQQISLWEVME